MASEIGAAHGSRIRKRARPLPRNGFISARASTLPSTITVSCETKVNTNVFQRARRKTALATTFSKFCSPTNENSRLPADELVRLSTSASRKGMATSSAM